MKLVRNCPAQGHWERQDLTMRMGTLGYSAPSRGIASSPFLVFARRCLSSGIMSKFPGKGKRGLRERTCPLTLPSLLAKVAWASPEKSPGGGPRGATDKVRDYGSGVCGLDSCLSCGAFRRPCPAAAAALHLTGSSGTSFKQKEGHRVPEGDTATGPAQLGRGRPPEG